MTVPCRPSARSFRNRLLPYGLLLPQLAVTAIFFIWPAGAGLHPVVPARRRLRPEDDLRRLRELHRALRRPRLPQFASGHGGLLDRRAGAVARAWRCCFAVAVDRVIKGARAYTTLLVWPYAVAPAVGGVMWWFLFNPTIGILPYLLRFAGYDWNHSLNPHRRHDPGGDRRELEPDLLQFPVLPRRPAVDPASRWSRRPRSTAPGRSSASSPSCCRCFRRRPSS